MTPNICRSPVIDITVREGEVVETATSDVVHNHVIHARPQSRNLFDHIKFRGNTYQGIMHVDETEQQNKSSESEDDIPVSTLLRQEKGISLTVQVQQIQDCRDGLQGHRAIGVSVANFFGGVEFRGIVDSYTTARQRRYYHVVYTDGDEEESSQIELRDAYLLGLSEEIETQWKLMNEKSQIRLKTHKAYESEVETSKGEIRQ